MSKKIAIIIVCYNGREYLPDLLNSLKNQTLKPTEIIFIDNDSKDDSVDYVQKNFSEVIFFACVPFREIFMRFSTKMERTATNFNFIPSTNKRMKTKI